MNESTLRDVPEPWLASSVEPAPRVQYGFEFHGTGAEYFRIWIVNLLLTIVTLGVFSAWAKVRRLRYFYGNTLLAGHSFEYHARPVAILKGRLLVFAVYVAFLVATQLYNWLLYGLVPLVIIGLPWILLRSRRFQLRMTSWRNVRFGFGGQYGGAMSAYLGWYLILFAVFVLIWLVRPNPRFMLIAFGVVSLLYPFWVHKRVEYSMDHATYGRESFGFMAGAGRFYVFCLATATMSIVAYFLFALLFFLQPSLRESIDANEHLQDWDLLIQSGPLGWLLLLGAAITGFAIAGYYKARLLNTSFGNTQIGLNYLRCRLSARRLARINVANLFGILLTLGLYYPWAKVRLVRYQLENMNVDSDGRLAEFLAGAHPETGALGEEASDFFDVDLGV